MEVSEEEIIEESITEEIALLELSEEVFVEGPVFDQSVTVEGIVVQVYAKENI